MTDEMYEKLKTHGAKPKTDRGVHAALLVGVVLLAALAVVALWGPVYKLRFDRYVTEISASTVASYEAGALDAADADGAACRYTADSAYTLYKKLIATGAGDPRMFAPGDAPTLTIRYADGAALKLWDLPPQKGRYNNTLVLEYTAADGFTYRYTNLNLSYNTLVVWLEEAA